MRSPSLKAAINAGKRDLTEYRAFMFDGQRGGLRFNQTQQCLKQGRVIVDAYGYLVFYIYSSLLGLPALFIVLHFLRKGNNAGQRSDTAALAEKA